MAVNLEIERLLATLPTSFDDQQLPHCRHSEFEFCLCLSVEQLLQNVDGVMSTFEQSEEQNEEEEERKLDALVCEGYVQPGLTDEELSSLYEKYRKAMARKSSKDYRDRLRKGLPGTQRNRPATRRGRRVLDPQILGCSAYLLRHRSYPQSGGRSSIRGGGRSGSSK